MIGAVSERLVDGRELDVERKKDVIGAASERVVGGRELDVDAEIDGFRIAEGDADTTQELSAKTGAEVSRDVPW